MGPDGHAHDPKPVYEVPITEALLRFLEQYKEGVPIHLLARKGYAARIR
jgi:hypothetical protein